MLSDHTYQSRLGLSGLERDSWNHGWSLDVWFITMSAITRIRRENPAFQRLDNIELIDTANDALIAYVKRTADNTVITVVNIDPINPQAGAAVIPASLHLPPSFTVRDLLADDDERYPWRIGPNYVRLEPGIRQAHVMEVLR